MNSREAPQPWEDRRYVEFGATPDCGESPLDLNEFLNITASVSSDSKDPQQEVLDEIQRRQSLQTFTINFESQSAQSDGISMEYPGVIRMSQDGSLIIRYTCDRKANTYGNFEIISFDQEENRFKFSSVEMAQKSAERFHDNPMLCAGCHSYSEDGATDLRPNWDMYPDWRGMFGSHDDFFPKGHVNELADVSHSESWSTPNRTEELEQFRNFYQSKVVPKSGASDPCYSTLPWLKPKNGKRVPDIFGLWPYGIANGSAKKRVYATRPNLKFTEVLSKLLARRNFRRLASKPEYKSVELLLAVEAAYCTEPSPQYGQTGAPPMSKEELDQMISKFVPLYIRPQDSEAKVVNLRGQEFFHHDPRHSSSRAQALFGVWKALSLTGADWTLVPFEFSEPNYETGAGLGDNVAFPADLPMTAYTQTQILESAISSLNEKALGNLFTKSKGESADFGEHFSCIDQLGGPISFKTNEDWKKLCKGLIRAARAVDQNSSWQGSNRRTPSSPNGNTRGIPHVTGIDKFNPKNESLNDYLRRINSELKRRGEFSY
jgi:hypothetical protein